MILNSGDLVFGDGIGVKIAGAITGQKVKDNVNGTDLLPILLNECESEGFSLFLLGAKPGVAQRMEEKIRNRFPGINIAGNHHGYFNPKESEIVLRKINSGKPDILLVAFGAPHQEKWIETHFPRLSCRVAMGVGGLFDFYSERIPRAPYLMRMAGMEWIFRLVIEPGRMWRRYVLGNPLFLFRILRWGREKENL